MGIKIRLRGDSEFRQSNVWDDKYHDDLAKRGIIVVEEGYDITILHNQYLTHPCGLTASPEQRDKNIAKWCAKTLDEPYIMVECDDSVHVTYPEILKSEGCIGYFRATAYRDPQLNNHDIYDSCYSHIVTADVLGAHVPHHAYKFHYRTRPVKSTEEELAKLKIAFPIRRTFSALRDDIIPMANREYDFSFIGNVYFDGSDDEHDQRNYRAPKIHREAMFEILQDMSTFTHSYLRSTRHPSYNWPDSADAEWVIPYYDYKGIMQNTQVAICPWGWAPWCWRDYEAIEAGCIVIKPRCHEVLIQPDVYHAESPWVRWCEPNFADLKEVIIKALDDINVDPGRQDRLALDRFDSFYDRTTQDSYLDLFADSIKGCAAEADIKWN